MLKKIGKLFLFALVFTMALTGCGTGFVAPKDNPSADAPVYNNGTMAVQKGDYLYYVNGKGSNTADNTYNTPIKGSIMRSKLSDNGTGVSLAPSSNDLLNDDVSSDTVMIVPKIFYSSNSKAGLYIYGDRIYYVSPSVEKDKKGNVLTSSTDVFSCKLDGTDIKSIAYVASNSFDYYFWQADDGTVYFAYVADSKVTSVNCSNGRSVTLVEEYTNTPVLGSNGSVYFTQSVLKDEEDESQTEMFNAFYSIAMNAASSDAKLELLDKNGRTLTTYYNVERDASDPEYDEKYDKVKELKINPMAYFDGYVIFGRNDDGRTGTTYSYTYAYNVETKDVRYITKLTLSSIVYVKEALIASYAGTNTVIVKVPFGSSIFDSATADTQAEILLNSSVTVLTVTDDRIYYLNSSSRIAYVPLTGDYLEKEETVISATNANTSGFAPVITDSVVYYLSSEGTFTDYLCYTMYAGLEEDDLTKIRIGKLSEADNTTLKEMHEADKPTKEE